MSDLVLAVDQGTTGTTVLLVDRSLRVRGRVTHEFRQIFPRPGWVEHDPEEIWRVTVRGISEALTAAGARPTDVVCIGITNQRETTALWDRRTGKPLHPAIVWQCRRTSEACERLRRRGWERRIHRRTGLVLDPYFSATKIAWLLDHVPGARRRAIRGELAFGTMDSWLLWNLTQGRVHATDVSNASRTLLLNLATLRWDPSLLRLFRVPVPVLPAVQPSSGALGRTRGLKVLPDGIPITGMAGDQQAALFGQTCFDAGMAKCTYGTGAFLVMNTGGRPVFSRNGLLSTVAWQVRGRTTYALEGSAFIAGAAVQWLRDGLGLIRRASEVERLAGSVPDSGGVLFVPALAGLGAPHWRSGARGLLTGLTRGTTGAHLARATLEGVAFQIADLARAMEADLGRPIRQLRVDGGAAANDLLLQIQSDLLGREIVRPKMIETTALGAALLAGLGVGLWRDPEAIRSVWKEDRRFQPRWGRRERDRRIQRWLEAVVRA